MPESFVELLAECKQSAIKLEFRDLYMASDPGYPRATAERASDVQSARIVSEPVSEYITFEHAVTPRVNLAAGELIRWVPRQRTSDLALPGNDVWVFDDLVVQFCFFAGDGRFTGNDVATDPAVVKFCVSAFEAAWERGIDHDDFRTTE